MFNLTKFHWIFVLIKDIAALSLRTEYLCSRSQLGTQRKKFDLITGNCAHRLDFSVCNGKALSKGSKAARFQMPDTRIAEQEALSCLLATVSVIKSLCDYNGYMIADHYQISSVIRDNSVIFAIVDHDSAVCSQETIRFHGIGNIPIQGSSPAQSAIVYNQNPPLQSSQQHVSQPSFLFPDTSLPDIMRCPVAVDCVSYISELQKPVGEK
eukprot:Em0008g342a